MLRLRKTACKNAHFVKYRNTVFTVREDAANAFVQSSSLLTSEKRNILKSFLFSIAKKLKKEPEPTRPKNTSSGSSSNFRSAPQH